MVDTCYIYSQYPPNPIRHIPPQNHLYLDCHNVFHSTQTPTLTDSSLTVFDITSIKKKKIKVILTAQLMRWKHPRSWQSYHQTLLESVCCQDSHKPATIANISSEKLPVINMTNKPPGRNDVIYYSNKPDRNDVIYYFLK